MPLLQVLIMEGRPPELKEKLIEELTSTISDTLSVKPESVRILVQEFPTSHWGVAGMSAKKRDEGKT